MYKKPLAPKDQAAAVKVQALDCTARKKFIQKTLDNMKIYEDEVRPPSILMRNWLRR